MKDAIEASGADVTVDYDSGTGGTLTVTNDGAKLVADQRSVYICRLRWLGRTRRDRCEAIKRGRKQPSRRSKTLIDRAVDAAASFGSDQKRIDTQAEFVTNLTDSLTTGIGSLVDADMEETSARLQALQVQQQLATQSLSIANQQPQNILSLFR